MNLSASRGQYHAEPGTGWFLQRYHLSKIRQVVVPWTSKRPLLSVIRPSAVPTRRPRLSTTPSAVIKPVSGVMGRKSEILNSRVV